MGGGNRENAKKKIKMQKRKMKTRRAPLVPPTNDELNIARDKKPRDEYFEQKLSQQNHSHRVVLSKKRNANSDSKGASESSPQACEKKINRREDGVEKKPKSQ